MSKNLSIYWCVNGQGIHPWCGTKLYQDNHNDSIKPVSCYNYSVHRRLSDILVVDYSIHLMNYPIGKLFWSHVWELGHNDWGIGNQVLACIKYYIDDMIGDRIEYQGVTYLRWNESMWNEIRT